MTSIEVKYHDCVTVLGSSNNWYISHCHNGVCGTSDSCIFTVCEVA